MATELKTAVRSGNCDEIRALLMSGEDVNASDEFGQSALHVAALGGQLEATDVLLEAGARINATDMWGATPLQAALRMGNGDVVERLRQRGAPEYAAPQALGSAVCLAAMTSRVGLLKCILERNPDAINAKDYDSRTALHIAASEGNAQLTRFLLERGAEVNSEDRWHQTPTLEAIRGSDAALVDTLQTAGGLWSNRHYEVRDEDVQLLERIGNGTVGDVYRAKWRGLTVAAKLLTVLNASVTTRIDFYNEIQVLSMLHHPKLVMMLGVCTRREGAPLFLLEYMPNGCLHTLIKQPQYQQGLPDHMVLKCSLNVAQAMTYLHSNTPIIIHRDLKPANLLFNEHGELKVADFGLSKRVTDVARDKHKMTGMTGTLGYMAPEIWLNESYTEKVDVFSFAIVLLFMTTGRRAFVDQRHQDAARALSSGLRPSLNAVRNDKFRHLISRCWHTNPAVRPTFGEIAEELEATTMAAPSRSAVCVIS